VDATFSTYLLSPSQLDGSGADLASVQFCYGVGTVTAGSGAEAQTGTMKITQAVVSELDENAAASSGSGAPPYVKTTLLSDPLDLTDGSNCQTLTPSSPAAINSSGYLQLTISAAFTATAGYANPNNNYVQSYVAEAPLTLGRITATYSPA